MVQFIRGLLHPRKPPPLFPKKPVQFIRFYQPRKYIERNESEIDAEHKLSSHDAQIRMLIEAIKELMEQPAPPPKGRIGFHSK